MVTGQLIDEICKCCGGDGIQMNMYSGLRQMCPCCGGTGRRKYMSDGSPIVTCSTD